MAYGIGDMTVRLDCARLHRWGRDPDCSRDSAGFCPCRRRHVAFVRARATEQNVVHLHRSLAAAGGGQSSTHNA